MPATSTRETGSLLSKGGFVFLECFDRLGQFDDHCTHRADAIGIVRLGQLEKNQRRTDERLSIIDCVTDLIDGPLQFRFQLS